MEILRDALGDAVDIALDFHGRFSTAAARRILPLLEPLLPLFVEEPVLPEFARDMRRITDATSIPIATGERLYSRWDFRDVLPTGIAVAQPDASHAGGISEVRRIAAMAEAYDVVMAPHCPLGPITLAASLQIDLATPNFLNSRRGSSRRTRCGRRAGRDPAPARGHRCSRRLVTAFSSRSAIREVILRCCAKSFIRCLRMTRERRRSAEFLRLVLANFRRRGE
ncbi:enolase C-terminal domain-like protein [Nonomuraea sp. SYSU D8015]|uniref:enolase C-terminal domain-like protein n=1 Tax=Nonomuraea sp. SYSU D8015 TaxID=2593644 RepID=UPI0021D26DDB|nr:enolase C-terminal domain-like protein [Nonomuraea sp. SYSU D8015]